MYTLEDFQNILDTDKQVLREFLDLALEARRNPMSNTDKFLLRARWKKARGERSEMYREAFENEIISKDLLDELIAIDQQIQGCIQDMTS